MRRKGGAVQLIPPNNCKRWPPWMWDHGGCCNSGQRLLARDQQKVRWWSLACTSTCCLAPTAGSRHRTQPWPQCQWPHKKPSGRPAHTLCHTAADDCKAANTHTRFCLVATETEGEEGPCGARADGEDAGSRAANRHRARNTHRVLGGGAAREWCRAECARERHRAQTRATAVEMGRTGTRTAVGALRPCTHGQTNPSPSAVSDVSAPPGSTVAQAGAKAIVASTRAAKQAVARMLPSHERVFGAREKKGNDPHCAAPALREPLPRIVAIAAAPGISPGREAELRRSSANFTLQV